MKIKNLIYFNSKFFILAIFMFFTVETKGYLFIVVYLFIYLFIFLSLNPPFFFFSFSSFFYLLSLSSNEAHTRQSVEINSMKRGQEVFLFFKTQNKKEKEEKKKKNIQKANSFFLFTPFF
ncbi:hypothetical protein HMI55_003232 [Coelomomyces lativittatus]|nr:hypothetical protein HMI55_003232 [Coelomomyces lativittatus]